MTVWNLHHSKLAIFSVERKEMVSEARFVLILKIDTSRISIQAKYLEGKLYLTQASCHLAFYLSKGCAIVSFWILLFI